MSRERPASTDSTVSIDLSCSGCHKNAFGPEYFARDSGSPVQFLYQRDATVHTTAEVMGEWYLNSDRRHPLSKVEAGLRKPHNADPITVHSLRECKRWCQFATLPLPRPQTPNAQVVQRPLNQVDRFASILTDCRGSSSVHLGLDSPSSVIPRKFALQAARKSLENTEVCIFPITFGLFVTVQ